MSKQDDKKTKEAFLQELQRAADEARVRVSGYSRRRRAQLLKMARKAIRQST